MVAFYMKNIKSGTRELPKYNATGMTSMLWNVTLPDTLDAGDVIHGPTIPKDTYLIGITVDVDDLDTGTPALTYEVGHATTAGAFLPNTTATGGTGGISPAAVGGTVGYTATTDTEILVTIAVAAATPAAGDMRMWVSYTGNP